LIVCEKYRTTKYFNGQNFSVLKLIKYCLVAASFYGLRLKPGNPNMIS